MPNEVPLALLLEGNVSEDAIANALFTSLTDEVPVIRALTAVGGVSPELIDRYLARTDTPALEEIVPLAELVEQLPRDLCGRLLAVPVRRDISTGTVDVVVADPSDPHPAREISFHLGARVQIMRGSWLAIERALQRMHPPPQSKLGSELPLTRIATRDGGESSSERLTESNVLPSFIAGPPPNSVAPRTESLRDPLANIAGILTDLRLAASRDEVLELLLGGARMVAARVALFVVKRDGYLGWACNPEFGDRVAFQSMLIAPQESSVFEAAVRDGFYLGPLHPEPAHDGLLNLMNHASSHVAVVAVRIRGKTAAIVLADDLSDTLATIRELTELASTAGDALMHVVRMRRS